MSNQRVIVTLMVPMTTLRVTRHSTEHSALPRLVNTRSGEQHCEVLPG